MAPFPLHLDDWVYAQTLLPADLEDSARASDALRRCRNIPNAAALIRLALAYVLTGSSLKDVAAWASSRGVANISGPGLFYRLREAEGWLERVLGQVLAEEVPPEQVGLSMRIVDVAAMARVDVLVSGVTGRIRSVQVTRHGAGIVARENEVLLFDRPGDPLAALASVNRQSAMAVLRFHPAILRTCDARRIRIRLKERECDIPVGGALEVAILLQPVDWTPARAIAARTRSGEVIWLLTTLPRSWTAASAMSLYRLRWRVELLFRRLQSQLPVDGAPIRDGPLANSWMLSRLLAAALMLRMADPHGPLSPWGYEVRPLESSDDPDG